MEWKFLRILAVPAALATVLFLPRSASAGGGWGIAGFGGYNTYAMSDLNDEVFDAAEDRRSDEKECLAAAEQASVKVNRLLDMLEPREREIIRLRAGLENGADGMTLEKIGEKLGITKERVRQLNVRAMKKLRAVVDTRKDEM